MKSVLISIQPKWCELIANGKKTVEVRKTKPKLETPFKVYIYMTKEYSRGINSCFYYYKNGKVIGEFVCDRVYDIIQYGFGAKVFTDNLETEVEPSEFIKISCLSEEQIFEYIGNKDGYAWHISNLVIYDKPKELSDFYKPCIDEEYQYCPCCKYGHEIFSPDEVECSSDVPGACYEQICLNRVKRPPQSWCYVESEVDTE